jgi:ubiquitin carboxyl-terminal hydrolase 5/13
MENKHVHRDECSKCFATPYDTNGLNVCLKCFLSFCPEHLSLHSEHQIFVNIQLRKKERKVEEKKQEITKIAIGKPGGVDADMYEW